MIHYRNYLNHDNFWKIKKFFLLLMQKTMQKKSNLKKKNLLHKMK